MCRTTHSENSSSLSIAKQQTGSALHRTDYVALSRSTDPIQGRTLLGGGHAAEVRKPGTKWFCVSKQANSQQGDYRPPRVERGDGEE